MLWLVTDHHRLELSTAVLTELDVPESVLEVIRLWVEEPTLEIE